MLSSLSSLAVLGKQTNLISNNIANANTAGYEEEGMTQSAVGGGGGVVAGQISVLASQTASAAANQAASAAAYSQQMSSALTAYTNALGQASDTSSLSSQLSAFTTSLTTLSSTPANGTAQGAAVGAAQSLVSTFHSLSGTIATQRAQADQAVAAGVASVNDTLKQLAQNETNRQLAASSGQSTADFDNQRSQLLSSLSSALPVKVFQSGNGGITVTTDQGTTLYDGSVHALSFTATPIIPANMRTSGDPANGTIGGLSQVTVDGSPIVTSQSGSIAANLQLRDVTLTGFSDALDRVAGNLVATFQSADPTVSTGQTGVFTAAGQAFDTTNPASISGLAAKIAVNAQVDPSQGGASWRMRDGAQATAQGAASDNTNIIGFVNALQSSQSASAVSGLPAATSLSDALSQVAGQQQSAASNWSSVNKSRVQQSTDAQAAFSNQTGVNIDEQMQRLLIVQQTYQASAEVIKTASSMLDSLITIVQ